MEENKKPDVFNKNPKSEAEIKAEQEMKDRTDKQISERNAVLEKLNAMGDIQESERQRYLKEMTPKVVRPELAEDNKPKGEIIYEEHIEEVKEETFIKDIESRVEKEIESKINKHYEALSEPQYDSNFDMIPLPSNGYLYGLKDKHLKTSFLNASDENILTNPNLLQSGKFLEILLNRKILNSKLRYKNLTLGDRDAIMIWLRYTGYGDAYPIQVYDPKTKEYFETIIELSKLKIKTLKIKPNSDGNFEFKCPSNNDIIGFNFLTINDIEELEDEELKIIEEQGEEFVNRSTSLLIKQIKSINGDDNKKLINRYVNNMRLGDVKALRKFISDNEHGIDMNLKVRTPGGESINTFLPINTEFFWPEQ